LSINPVGTFMVCVPTRILMGIVCGLIFMALRKQKVTKQYASFFVASLGGALLNTAFFMSTLMLFFYQSDFIQGIIGSIPGAGASVLAAILLLVGTQGFWEAVICTVVGTAVSKALYKSLRL